MQSILRILILTTLSFSTAFGQYQVTEKTEMLCQEPECIEARTRGLSKKEIQFQQNIYQIASRNAVLFIPDAFIPESSAFQITGATKYITKVQIYTIEDNKLIFQTAVAEKIWDGKWKAETQYGFFKYVITIALKDGETEPIEGIVGVMK
jgi:hypothetical protein